MEINYTTNRCGVGRCDWAVQVPAMFGNDTKRHADELFDRHLRDQHGLMSVLKHEYELANAVSKATLEGERRGQQKLQESIKEAVMDAIREMVN